MPHGNFIRSFSAVVTVIGALLFYPMVASAAGDDPVALKVVEASSQFNALKGKRSDNARAAANLVDGDTDSVWEVYNMKNNPQGTWSWVTVDLGTAKAAQSVTLSFVPLADDHYLSLLRPRQVVIAGSNTAPSDAARTTYTESDAMSGFEALCPVQTIPTEGDGVAVGLESSARYRYLRIVFPPFPEGNPTLVLSEVQVFASAQSGGGSSMASKGARNFRPYSAEDVAKEIEASGSAFIYARLKRTPLSKDFEEKYLLAPKCPAELCEKPIFFFDVSDAGSPYKKYGLMRVPALVIETKFGHMTLVYTKETTEQDLERFLASVPASSNAVGKGN